MRQVWREDFRQVLSETARVIYIATLIESFAVVTNGPELIAGSIPIFLNRNGSVRPSVVATIIAQNMAAAKAGTSRAIWMSVWSGFKCSMAKQMTPPSIPQARATSRAIRTSLVKT